MSTIKENQSLTYHEEIDKETGEVYKVIDSHIISTQKIYKDQDEFIQIYLEDMAGLMSIGTKSELQVLCCLWKYSTYSTEDKGNCVIITSKILKTIEEVTDLQTQSIRNIISKLTKGDKHLLIKDPEFRATYYLNPTYFFKGALRDRPKVMKVILTYVQE